MDPISIVSLAGACVTLAARVAAAASAMEAVANADRAVASLATTLRVFGASLDQLQQWLAAADAVVSADLYSAVRSSVADCEVICADLEEHVRRVRPGERRMGISGRLRHLWGGNALAEQETRLSRQLQSVMLLVNLVRLNDAERQDAGMRNAETRSILARSAFDARSLRMPGDSASTIRNSVLSAGGDLDKHLDVDEELVHSGPYLVHYQDSPTSSSSSSGLLRKSPAWKSSHEGRLLVAQLCQASKDGNIRWAERLLKDGADIDGYCVQEKTKISPVGRWSTKEKGKATPLVCAVEGRPGEGRVEMVKFLLDRGADPNNPDAMERSVLFTAARGTSWSPLHAAAEDGDSDVVDLLLDRGVKVDLTGVHDGVAKVTALHVARKGRVAQRLISAGASVFAVDSNGQTPLFWAVKRWLAVSHYDEFWKGYHRETVLSAIEVNLQNGAPVNLRDKRGKTPLDLLKQEPEDNPIRRPLLLAGAQS